MYVKSIKLGLVSVNFMIRFVLDDKVICLKLIVNIFLY